MNKHEQKLEHNQSSDNMDLVVKVREPIPCGICKEPFIPPYSCETLCDACRKALPTCDCCGSVMCSGFGYLEQFACKVGEYSICWRCKANLHKNGYLRPTQTTKLLPSGTVVKIRPPWLPYQHKAKPAKQTPSKP